MEFFYMAMLIFLQFEKENAFKIAKTFHLNEVKMF